MTIPTVKRIPADTGADTGAPEESVEMLDNAGKSREKLDNPGATPPSAQAVRASLAECEVLLGRCRAAESRILEGAGKMADRYRAALGKVAENARRGHASSPALGDCYERLLRSRHTCERIALEGES